LPRLKAALRTLGGVCAALLLALLAYGVAGWIGSALPRNAGRVTPSEGVGILVESNGVHTALVLPLVTPDMDWRGHFPLSDIADPARPYTHVSISWGEREVFLNTPTWWDLRPTTVLRVLGMGSTGALHVAHYVRPAPGDRIRPLLLSRAEYARLVAAIETRLPEQPYARHPGYADYDVFYDAPGTYTAINTCNQWTGDVMAEAGLPMGRWTPFAGGVMRWVPRDIR
jgi:uncharacterized protein (TIGR02117 family)